jgi:hypothetical protein
MIKATLITIWREKRGWKENNRPSRFDSRQCRIFLFCTLSRPALWSRGIGGFFPGEGGRQGSEADNSPQCGAEVDDDGAYLHSPQVLMT